MHKILESKSEDKKQFPNSDLLAKYKKALSELPDNDGKEIKYQLENSILAFDCKCGCHSFSVKKSNAVEFNKLGKNQGAIKEIAFKTNYSKELNVIIFIDSEGYLSTIDVCFGPENVEPVPDDIQILGIDGIW